MGYNKRVSPDLLVWAVGALAEGLGIRAVARVFEADANTVLQWLGEAAAHLQAFSQYFLYDVRVTQVQLDELYALLSAVFFRMCFGFGSCSSRLRPI